MENSIPASPFRDEDLSKARELFVSQVFFSGSTYQIEVIDHGESFWIFLQLKEGNQPKDFFCTCDAFEEFNSCPHLAAGFLKIFEKGDAMHVRFQSSIWNILCRLASRRHGYKESELGHLEDGSFIAKSSSDKELFFLHPKNDAAKDVLRPMLIDREKESEESSIKFSNLPPEELTLWKKKKPSHNLRYELSFWSDLAKWMMWLYDEGSFKEIRFLGDGLPKQIEVEFDEFTARFYIAEVNWSDVLPALMSIPSPIPIHEHRNVEIQTIEYQVDARELHIQSQEVENDASGDEIELEDWVFSKSRGFFPKEEAPLLREKVIASDNIEQFLMKYPELLDRHLTNAKVVHEPKKPHYNVYFDAHMRLHLDAFLFEKGDLTQEPSAGFDKWVYHAGLKSFFRLKEPLFRGVKQIIAKDKVGEFVTAHRLWLGQFEGFQTHLSNIDTKLLYRVDDKQRLLFEADLSFLGTEGEIQDFGDWIYIENQGFFSKGSGPSRSAIQAGLSIEHHDVAPLLRKQRHELEQIKGFFSAECPVSSSGIDISISPKGRIVVDPSYAILDKYKEKNLSYFDEFVFVEGEGFSQIPGEWKLPSGFEKQVEIPVEDEGYFVAFELEKLEPYIRHLDVKLRVPKKLNLQISHMRREAGGDWVVSLAYQTEHGSFPAALIWKGIKSRKTHLMTKAGLFFLKQSRFDWLMHLSKEKLAHGEQQFHLSSIDLMRLKAFESVELAPTISEEHRKFFEDTYDITQEVLPELKGFKSELRPYQEIGVKWLYYLYQHGLSGLLADEMGLGKTHQAMGIISALLGEKRKFLVVCPTSVIFHWEELLKKFLPKIRVLTFYGVSRKLTGFKRSYDLLLTSYGTLRSEKEKLSSMHFELAVFDELQVAKNKASQVHKSLKSVDAYMKLGLTGTPIENYLRELKALFDIILPSYFPSDAHFRELFVNPIEKLQDPERKTLLKRLIQPFIMRRKKSEVLDDLPEKIEEISYCPLSPAQTKLYEEAYSNRAKTIDELEKMEAQAFYTHIFALLNALKQICDHPALFLKQPKEYTEHESGKWDLFVELLHEARESGQKVVVFSQYLDMLDIIEAYLKKERIDFAGIRGSTKDRKEQVQRFRDDPKCEVFVASLQAAGVGIDLVAASVVIHYDRWWNPAREDQATDRVHRIGQNRGVQVFKLVTRNSVEEHIHALIERKQELIQTVVGYDDQDEIKHLDRSELIELLKQIHQDLG